MPRKKHTTADRLLKRLQTESDDIDKQYKTDIKDFINAELGALSIAPMQAGAIEESAEEEGILGDRYSEDSQKIMLFLTTLKKPSGIDRGQFRAFKKQALNYTVIRKQLYRCRSKNMPSRLVVNSPEKRATILKELHDEYRHKGQESIY